MMKVLVLTSSTGGGHDMRARSLKAWAESSEAEELGLEVEIFQTLEQTHGVYHFGVGLYNWIQNTLPALHHIYFNVLEKLSLHREPTRIVGKVNFVEKIKKYRPQVLVSTHAHLNHGFFQLAREAMEGEPLRCVTYCGELFGGYGFSRHWVNPQADAFIGAVAETCEAAAEWGMESSRNHIGGFLLNPKFYGERLSSDEQSKMIAELGLEQDRFTIVLATGANSANNHVALLDAIRGSDLRPQVVALCGRSKSALEAVTSWGSVHRDIPVKALPYCDNLFALFQIASVVVARPGTGTTSECIMSECPIVFNGVGGIMPQECITVEFARKHGFARVMKRPGDLPELLRPLMEDKSQWHACRKALAAVRPRQHPLGVLRILSGMQADLLS